MLNEPFGPARQTANGSRWNHETTAAVLLLRPTFMRESAVQNRISAILALVALGCATSMFAACNTTAGAGRDISATGHAITDTAQDTKDKM
jgi:predicted small secreted protein